jgi:hypothetical protein
MNILCPVSVGELIDKVSILIVKNDRLKDKDKKEDCHKELLALTPLLLEGLGREVEALKRVNSELYTVLELQHDLLTACDWDNIVEKKFIETAKKVHDLNMRRFQLKAELNKKYNSEIIDRKSY